jgi:F-type H+-transporting ATPase subunit b
MRRLLLILPLAATLVFAQEGHKAEASHESGGGEHAQLNPLWKWANFAMLACLIAYGIKKGAGPFFKGRDEEIQKALVEAKTAREEAEKRSAEIDKRMANLESEIQALRNNSVREMQAEAGRIQTDTEKQMTRLQEVAQQEIESAAKNATSELKAFASALALQLAEQKIKSQLTPDRQGALVTSFVNRLREKAGSN